MAEESEVICLSSDSEEDCCILDEGEESKKIKNQSVLNNLKDDLSRIRNFTPIQKSSSEPKKMKQQTLNFANGRVHSNYNERQVIEESAINGKAQEIVLDSDGDDGGFEIEYNKDENVDDDDKKAGKSVITPPSSSCASGSLVGSSIARLRNNLSVPLPVNGIVENEEDYINKSEAVMTALKLEMLKNKPNTVKRTEAQKAMAKVDSAFNKIKHLSKQHHLQLQAEIQQSLQEMKLATNAKKYWLVIRYLVKEVMTPEKMAILGEIPISVSNEARESKKKRHLMEAELTLQKIQKKVQEYAEREVDWDDKDEHNSAYILESKAKKLLVDTYYRICDITKCSHFTGRSVQKSIKLKKHGASTNYDDIDLAIEKFVNKGGCLFIPDYSDIYQLVTDVNKKKSLGLSSSEVSSLAQQAFECIVKIIKCRRKKDLDMSLLCELPLRNNVETFKTADDDEQFNSDLYQTEDPADNDPELLRKLEENDKVKKKESDVLEKFTKLAEEQGGHAKEVPESENANESPPPSDEEENDDGDDEGNHDSQNDKMLSDELTEDEDEIPETIRIIYSQEDSLEDRDDIPRSSVADSESDPLGPIIINSVTTVIAPSSVFEKRKYDDDDDGDEIDSEEENCISSSSSISCDKHAEPPLKKYKVDDNSNDGVKSGHEEEIKEDNNLNEDAVKEDHQ